MRTSLARPGRNWQCRDDNKIKERSFYLGRSRSNAWLISIAISPPSPCAVTPPLSLMSLMSHLTAS